jgi:hypothetical protein
MEMPMHIFFPDDECVFFLDKIAGFHTRDEHGKNLIRFWTSFKDEHFWDKSFKDKETRDLCFKEILSFIYNKQEGITLKQNKSKD